MTENIISTTAQQLHLLGLAQTMQFIGVMGFNVVYCDFLYLDKLYQLTENVQVQVELLTWVALLLLAPVAQAAAVLSHHQVDVFLVNAVVMQLAHAWDVPEAVHDANLCESNQLQQSTHSRWKAILFFIFIFIFILILIIILLIISIVIIIILSIVVMTIIIKAHTHTHTHAHTHSRYCRAHSG